MAAAILALLVGLVPGTARGVDEAFSGEADGVRWAVYAVQTRLPAQQALRWDYVLILRETRGRDVQLDLVEGGIVDRSGPPPGAGSRGVRRPGPRERQRRETPIARRLAAHGELRFKHWDRSETGQSAIEVYRRFRGRDSTGKDVAIEITMKLDPKVGERAGTPTALSLPGDLDVPSPPDIRLVTPPASVPSGLTAFAGAWRGRWGGEDGRPGLLVVEDVSASRSVIMATAWGPGRDSEPGWERLLAGYQDGALSTLLTRAGRMQFRSTQEGTLTAVWRAGDGSILTGLFTRLDADKPATPAKGPATAEHASQLVREARAALQDGRLVEALPKAEEALAVREHLLGARDPAVAESLNVLGEVYRAQGRLQESERALQRALSLRESVLGPKHPDVAATLNNLALLNTARAAYTDAEALLKRALAIAESAPESAARTRLQAEIYESLASVYRGLGRVKEAQDAQARAMFLVTQ
jgi:hypothetical protein